MVDFSTIIKRGQRRSRIKSHMGKWGRCESCEERKELYPYSDEKGEIWMLCSECSDGYVKEEL